VYYSPVMSARKALLAVLLVGMRLLAAEPELAPLPLPVGRAHPPPPPRWLKRGQLGTLVIQSATRGASVHVDGLDVGTVPIKPMPLTAGAHDVRLAKPGFREHVQRVRVRSGRKAVVKATLRAVRGVLHVGAQLPGARVFVDGKDAGAAPLSHLEIAPGQRRLRLETPGASPIEETLRVSAGKEYTAFAGAAPLPELPFAEKPPAQALVAPPPSKDPVAPKATDAAKVARAVKAAEAAKVADAVKHATPQAADAGKPAAAPKPEAAGPAARDVPAPPLVVAEAAPRPPLLARRDPAPRPAVAPAAVTVASSAEPPLAKRWYVWAGGAAVATAAVFGIFWALPARYVEKRDPAAACGGPCGIVVNNGK